MYSRILVPLDGSPTSLAGLDETIRLARIEGSTLRLLHVVDELKYAWSFDSLAGCGSDLIPLMQKAGEQILRSAPVPVLLVHAPRAGAVAPATSRVAAKA
jgi:nucleotide-binding universal stress UspA family protein